MLSYIHMCGIAGKIQFGRPNPKMWDEVSGMLKTLVHRGPDADGIFVNKEQTVGLGHRRLSIIDLSASANQPMSDQEKNIWVVFNGEIYNFQELKQELERDGFRFRTHSDTEVIIYLYKKLGVRCLQKLRGMFAFGIWDENKKQLFLARDRLGKKPLKYFTDGKRLIFASELKAILQNPEVPKHIDYAAIDEYLTYQYVPHPKTGFLNIQKLEPATYLLVSADGNIKKERYWELNFEHKLGYSEAEWEQRLFDKLQESVKLRLISDVPFGAHLSGGIDSSLVVALMSSELKYPVKTFSIGFEEKDYNELPYAKLVSDRYHTEHHEYVVKPDAMETLPKLAYHYEEPYADSSALPTWYLSEVTKRQVTMVLNGDGGDENFAGYSRYNVMRFYRRFALVPFKRQMAAVNRRLYGLTGIKLFNKGARFLSSYQIDPLDFYLRIIDYFGQDDKQKIYTSEFQENIAASRWHTFLQEYYKKQNLDWLDRLLSADINTYLPDDLLVKVDIASMAHALEIRSPFLDHEFMELMAKMPSSLKLVGSNKKYLLKKIAYQYLPKECIDRPKQGFGVPLEFWFRGKLNQFLKDQLLEKRFLDYGVFEAKSLMRMIDDHREKRQNHAIQLWALLFLRAWLRTWFEQATPL